MGKVVSLSGSDDGRAELPLLLRPAEVARLLNVSRSKCYELLAAGTLPSIRIGQSIRVPRADLLNWIEAHKCAGRAPTGV